MSSIPLEHGLVVAAALFAIGLAGVLIRRNILFILLSIEIMLNGAGLAFVLAGARWYKPGAQPDGQVMFVLILTVTAAEVCVGLALVLRLYHSFKTLDSQAANRLRG